MREIQGEALRLFESKGYGGTTIDQIAEASDISPRTSFRYFPTKVDVLWDEYDAVVGELLAGQASGGHGSVDVKCSIGLHACRARRPPFGSRRPRMTPAADARRVRVPARQRPTKRFPR
jgi:AcrR family transcriptional regulator